MQRLLKFVLDNVQWFILAGIMALAIVLRLSTAGFTNILDYDPWWFFRWAQTILANNFVAPRWDLLSYFPPGRPVDFYLGWSYTIAFFYAIFSKFVNVSLAIFSGYFVVVFAALGAIPAYFVGKHVTNRWGGLVTAFFGTIAPISITRSLAGYPAADMADVFYNFLVVLTTLYTISVWKDFSFSSFRSSWKSKKSLKYVWSVLIAVLTYWLFSLNFNSSWYIYYIFVLFIPFILFFKVIENVIAKKSLNLLTIVKENQGLILSIIAIGVVGEIVTYLTSGWPFNTIDPIAGIIGGLNFLNNYLIVNVSIAELQPLNVFSWGGFLGVLQNVGTVPVLLGLFGLPLMLLYKLATKKEIHTAEYFTIVWMIIGFWMITRGLRLALLFSLATAAGSGFVIGNLIEYLKARKNILLFATIIGIILFAFVWDISDNTQVSLGSVSGLQVDQNWIDALNWLKANSDNNTLVATWWDPGHIITGYTGLKVFADGAHCAPGSCIPYNINDRIVDMGTIFTTSNETQAVSILQKYTQLTPLQQQAVLQAFGNAVPQSVFTPVDQVYLIASSDLIAKYYWMSCFSMYAAQCTPSSPNVAGFIQFYLAGRDNSGGLVYQGPGDATITLAQTNTSQVVAVLNSPSSNIRSTLINDVVLYQNGQELDFNYGNVSSAIQAMAWISPDFSYIFFMQSSVENSMFTRMFFFNGAGLQHFQLVFSNAEIKIFKVKF